MPKTFPVVVGLICILAFVVHAEELRHDHDGHDFSEKHLLYPGPQCTDVPNPTDRAFTVNEIRTYWSSVWSPSTFHFADQVESWSRLIIQDDFAIATWFEPLFWILLILIANSLLIYVLCLFIVPLLGCIVVKTIVWLWTWFFETGLKFKLFMRRLIVAFYRFVRNNEYKYSGSGKKPPRMNLRLPQSLRLYPEEMFPEELAEPSSSDFSEYLSGKECRSSTDHYECCQLAYGKFGKNQRPYWGRKIYKMNKYKTGWERTEEPDVDVVKYADPELRKILSFNYKKKYPPHTNIYKCREFAHILKYMYGGFIVTDSSEGTYHPSKNRRKVWKKKKKRGGVSKRTPTGQGQEQDTRRFKNKPYEGRSPQWPNELYHNAMALQQEQIRLQRKGALKTVTESSGRYFLSRMPEGHEQVASDEEKTILKLYPGKVPIEEVPGAAYDADDEFEEVN